ncbi:MAG: alpha/beta fold hydrolase [Alphaproteobacteria bacterium]|jgi:pimeloyl-ACP methyl ester carboxylesterase|nr:alpha/beta fold hydrolase [Alphaproteobacteria bacterium]MDP6819332.1 alpha/beta fold hydrolase [Alphaproteobacteria bacterium]|tara:strand:+ start:218 stop:1060 length:843 start_codon:yes stop_codon:yes gene_type:complete
MAFAEINGAKLWYEVTGEGEPVMHIHGAGFGHFNFATATPVESKYFQCVDYDQRGYGLSEKPIQDYDMEVWADDLAALMDHLGLETAHVHGTSMGGMVAQVFGAKYGHRTRRLIINCSAAKLDTAGKLTFKTWIDIAESMGCGSRALAELLAVQALSHNFLDGPDGAGAIDMIQDILERSNRKEVFQRACQAMIDMDLRDWARSIAVPTLVIGGDEDIMTPWNVGPEGCGQEWLAQNIPGAVKYVVKGSNHSTLFDGTEENMRVVVNFLQSNNDLTAALG